MEVPTPFVFTRELSRSGISIVCMVVLAVLGLVQPVSAGGVVGTGTADSCTAQALDKALAGGGRVTFKCGPTPVTIVPTSNKIITRNTKIDGGGLITISGAGETGVFAVPPKVSLILANLTVADGYADLGAGLYNEGKVKITNVTFSDNNANYDGGAIYNRGVLTVTNSTFSDNSAPGGGGIYNQGPMKVSNTTFSGNYATGVGGGIASFVGTVMVDCSTFSDNSAVYFGGGIYNQSTFTLVNSTIWGNEADGIGGGVAAVGGSLTMTNTTLAGNNAGNSAGGLFTADASFGSAPILQNTIVADNTGGNCSGAIGDGGNNLQFPDDSCGESILFADPKLDPAGLSDNGGPTQTIALQERSPAINAGNQRICRRKQVHNIDQRGFFRPGFSEANCSIGAYEFNARGRVTGAPPR
jgi:predicted outer membrane repeat protein